MNYRRNPGGAALLRRQGEAAASPDHGCRCYKIAPVAHQEQTRTSRAFTLVELLVVLGTVAMLAAVLLSASFTTPERVMRAQCVANLRQLANGWNMYQQDFNQMMPCHWPGVASPGGSSNPWRTYEAGRVYPGPPGGWGVDTGEPNGFTGPWNLGLLFDTKLLPDARVFYCPATARMNIERSYEFNASVSNIWPSLPSDYANDKIRTGYNYLPQGRKRELISASLIGPKLTSSTALCPGSSCFPLQQTELSLKQSLMTDLVNNYDTIAHRSSGTVAGINALFPDGRVVFQNARTMRQAFDPNLWKSSSDTDYIGNNPVNFRYVMSLWQSSPTNLFLR
jgi:type II secretory pathway pseudopilin PulG